MMSQMATASARRDLLSMTSMALAVVCAVLAAAHAAPAATPLQVASFCTVVTEIAREVGGDHVKVAGLVRPGVDPHEYQPTPDDLKEVSQSRLILVSGRHLGGYINKLQEAAGGRADLVKVGDRVAALSTPPAPGDHAENGTPSSLIEDPHWWHSVDNVRKATRIVRDELTKLDPADEADFLANATKYLASLDALEAWVKRKVAELPRDKRKLVTSHNAFQYLARDCGFTIYAIEGVSTETEPSNRHVADLIDQIKKEGVKAIFLESTLNPKVTSEITRETGAILGGTLYADGLGSGAAATYAGMMKHNVATIVDALK
jgi:zinc/manganese transport system substrate-binding protein